MSRDDVVDRLVLANRVLVGHGIVDAFGHVSVRDPRNPERFLMARRKPPELVGRDDIRDFGLDGELVDRDGTPVFLERFIHSAIYAARPDVNGVVHSHSYGAVLFSVLDQPLRAICHTCAFLEDQAPVFEIRDHEQASNLLVRNPELAEALAGCLGQSSVVLMRGHGSTAVGDSLECAVYRAVYTELNAKLQATAQTLGKVTFLSPEEAAAMNSIEAVNLERAWDLWRAQFG